MQTNGKQTSKKCFWKKIGIAAAAIAVAAVIFFAGFYVSRLTLDGGIRSLLWFKQMIDREYIDDIADEDFWQAAIDGAESLLDRYSAYYTKEEYDVIVNSNQGIKTGTGLSFFSNSNKIVSVAVNSPVFFTGKVRAGMYVTGIGDSEQSVQDTFTAEGGGYSYAALSTLFANYGEDQEVCLRLSGESPTQTQGCSYVTVRLETYTESYVLYAADGRAYANLKTGEQIVWTDVSDYVDVDEQVTEGAYLSLSGFYGNAAADFGRALEQYRADGESTLLLDLRNDGGGDVEVMCGIASYLLRDAKSEDAIVMTAQYGNGKEEIFRAAGNEYANYLQGSRVYVAANRNTASASEALLGAMISYGTLEYGDIYITDTVGDGNASTYGKGIMQATYYNPLLEEAVKLTTAKIYWPNGTCIHGVGITTADGALASPAQTFADYKDPELTNILAAIAAR